MHFTSARWSDVYLATAARAASICGDYVAATALLLALQERGAGGFAVAAVLLGSAVPMAVLAPLTGRLVDRVDSRLLLGGTSVAQAGICAVLAYASGTAEVIVLVTLLGAGLAVTQPTLAALLPSMVGREDLPRASAIGQTANMVGMLVAPALGGLLVGRFGLRTPLLLDAATYLLLTAAALAIRTRRGDRTAAAAARGGAAGRAGWSLRRDPLLRSQFALSAAVLAVVSAVNVVEVFFIRGTLRSSTTLYGLVGAAWVAGMVAGAWLLARRRRSDGQLGRATLAQLGTITVVGLVSATVPRAEWLLPLWLVGGACNGGLNVAMAVQLGRRVPEEWRGRAWAIYTGAINGANVIGYVLGGALLEVATPRLLIAGTEAAGLLTVLAFALPVIRAARWDPYDREPDHSGTARTVDNHERTAASPGRPHPVPELPAHLLGPDALGRAPRP
jgi:MFS family permease